MRNVVSDAGTASISRFVLATASCVAAATVLSAQQPSQAPVVHTLHVQKNVHMMAGPAGNTVVQVGEDGPLVVDAQPSDAAQALRAAIRALSPKPIHTIIDTHLLSDRPGGDDALIKLRGTGASQQVRVEHLAKPGLTIEDNPHHVLVIQVDGDKLSVEIVGVRPFAPYNGSARVSLDN